MRNPFRYFNSSPVVIRLAVMMYVRFPLSLRHVEDLLHERGIDICHETVRFWWNRFGPMFAAEIRKKRSAALRALPQWRWHLDEVFVKIIGEMGGVRQKRTGHRKPAIRRTSCRRKFAPLGEGGGAIELEILAAVEVAFLVEVVVN